MLGLILMRFHCCCGLLEAYPFSFLIWWYTMLITDGHDARQFLFYSAIKVMCFGILIESLLSSTPIFVVKWSFESSTDQYVCGSIPILIKSMDLCPDHNRKFGSRYLMGDCCLPSFGCLPRTSPKFVSDWLTTLRGLLASCKTTTSSAASSYRNVLFSPTKYHWLLAKICFIFTIFAEIFVWEHQ